jgi:hypothetical protein
MIASGMFAGSATQRVLGSVCGFLYLLDKQDSGLAIDNFLYIKRYTYIYARFLVFKQFAWSLYLAQTLARVQPDTTLSPQALQKLVIVDVAA